MVISPASPDRPAFDTGDLFGAEFLARLNRLRIRARKRHNSTAPGLRRSQRRGSGMDYADFREFAQGDDPRLLDWALYARTGRLFVKLYEEEGDLTLHILVDLSRSMLCGDAPGILPGHPLSKLGRALQCAAAIGHIALHGLDRVRIHLFDRSILRSSRMLRGPSSFAHLLEFLQSHRFAPPPGAGPTDLARAASDFCRSQPGSGVCLLISDLLDPAFEPGLSLLAHRPRELHVVQIRGHDEIQTPTEGEFDFVDAENGVERPVLLNSRTWAEHAGMAEQFRGRIRAFCLRRGIGLATSLPDQSFESAAFEILSKSSLFSHASPAG